MVRSIVLLAAALAAILPAQAGEAKDPVRIDEWEVPFERGRPRDPHAVSAEEVWFVGQRNSYLARLNPGTGEFVRRDLKDAPAPHNLIVGSDGIVWYAGNRKGYIGRYDPASGEIERIAMPREDARDPHTLIFDADESHIWFTLQGSNMIGRLRIADRHVDLLDIPASRSRPYGIRMGPDGTVWVALFGTNRLASVDPATLELTEHVLPDPGTRPRRLEVTGDGRVYYVDYARGVLGRLDPADGSIEEWPMPSGERARPYGTATDSQGRIWFVETGVSPNNFVGFDPKSETFFSVTPIPSGGGAVRHMHYHEPTGSVWFGTDEQTIGRAVVE